MRKCPTCGQWARKGQETCSRCGAMLTEISFSTAPHAAMEEPRKSAPQLGRWDMHPTGPVFEVEDETGNTDAPPGEAPPPSETPEPAPARRPPWIRVLLILAFFLFPVISSFLRNWSSFRQQTEPPVVREVVISQSVVEGEPPRPQTRFSLQRDKEVAIVSRWTGSNDGHEFVVVWMEPQSGGPGNATVRQRSAALLRREKDGAAFSVSGTLPLTADMPAGVWVVGLLMDGETRASTKFVLEK